MRHTLDVVHWLPVEMYPPAINLVRYFAASGRWDVALHTTANHHGRPAFDPDRVALHRSPAAAGTSAGRRAGSYLAFHLGTARRLVVRRPDVVLYVEPQSSFPVFLASLVRPALPLVIHHHEYHEPEQFLRPGMRLPRLFHRLEAARLFGRAAWISHTNEERLRLFLADHPGVDPQVGHVLPNFPPSSWFGAQNQAWTSAQQQPLRLVYVGSLSRKDTYIEEAVRWVQGQPAGRVTLDIYAYNLHDETRTYLLENEGGGVRFISGGVSYDDLPRTLRCYHTGLLLYRANTANYRFNASNKLFEYLACGLDVVYPREMLGVRPYAREDVAPRVLEVDFQTGAGLDYERLAMRGNVPNVVGGQTAEAVLAELEAAMIDVIGKCERASRRDV